MPLRKNRGPYAPDHRREPTRAELEAARLQQLESDRMRAEEARVREQAIAHERKAREWVNPEDPLVQLRDRVIALEARVAQLERTPS